MIGSLAFEKPKEWVQPKSWGQLETGVRVRVKFPHPEAAIQPHLRNMVIWREGEIDKIRTGHASVYLFERQATMEVTSLESIEFYGHAKQTRGRGA